MIIRFLKFKNKKNATKGGLQLCTTLSFPKDFYCRLLFEILPSNNLFITSITTLKTPIIIMNCKNEMQKFLDDRKKATLVFPSNQRPILNSVDFIVLILLILITNIINITRFKPCNNNL